VATTQLVPSGLVVTIVHVDPLPVENTSTRLPVLAIAMATL